MLALVFCQVIYYMNEQEDIELAPIDPEIERTIRRRLREQRAQNRLNMAEEVEGVEGANNVTNTISMADDRENHKGVCCPHV